MTFAIVLLCTVVACFALRNPLHKAPMVFYVVAVAVDVFFAVSPYLDIPRNVWLVFNSLIANCMLPLAIFVVVMFIGVLPKSAKAYLWLKAVRAELSIVAWILSLGHMVWYLGVSYLPKVLAGTALKGNVVFGLFVAIVLLLLLIVLGVTSFNVVKKHMRTDTWKKVQKLAYPFFILVYVHLLLMLAPAAMRGSQTAIISVVVYSVVFVAYVVLRLYRAAADGKERPATT